MAVVGTIAPGLPPVGLPSLSLSDLRSLLGPAIAIGLLVYADSAVTGQVLARRGRYRIDADGEFCLGAGAEASLDPRSASVATSVATVHSGDRHW